MRKWVIGIPTIVLAAGAFFLCVGLRMCLFPQVRGQIQGGVTFVMGGAAILIAGIILMLVAVTHEREEIKNPISRRAKKRNQRSSLSVSCLL